MLLKVLLRKVVEYIDVHPVETGCLIVKIEASRHNMDHEEFVTKIDLRHIGVLRELVPKAFPLGLRYGVLDISQNIHGAWRVEKKKEAPNG